MSDDTGLKAIITVCVLAAAFVIAIVIAKIVENCYSKRQQQRGDTDSDVSENMHDLIQSRLSVIRFKQKGRKKTQKRVEKNIFSKWLKLARSNKQNRNTVLKENRHAMGITNNNNGEVIVKPSADSVSVKDPPRTPRAPIFAGGKSPTQIKRSPTQIKREASSNQMKREASSNQIKREASSNQIKREASSNQIKREVSSVTVNDLNHTLVSPVAKGQPVSSILHQVQKSSGPAITTINEVASESKPKNVKRENTKRENTKVGVLTTVREKTEDTTMSKQTVNSEKTTMSKQTVNSEKTTMSKQTLNSEKTTMSKQTVNSEKTT